MRNLLCTIGLLVLISAHARAYQILSITDTNLPAYETLEGSQPIHPDYWVIRGDKNGADMFTPGAPKLIWDYFSGGQGFMRLTETGNPYDRSCMYYTNMPIWSGDIGIAADIRVGPGTGGLAFSWIEVPFEGETTAVFTNKMLGGFGYFLGAPRGLTHVPDGIGYESSVRGYSLQFSTISNDISDSATQMVVCRKLDDWTTVPGSLSTGQCVAGTWIRFKLSQSMLGTSGKFDLAWGPTFTTTNTWFIPDYTNVPVYLGVSAATGPLGTSHDVRHLALYGSLVPEPTSMVAVLAFLALARRKR